MPDGWLPFLLDAVRALVRTDLFFLLQLLQIRFFGESLGKDSLHRRHVRFFTILLEWLDIGFSASVFVNCVASASVSDHAFFVRLVAADVAGVLVFVRRQFIVRCHEQLWVDWDFVEVASHPAKYL